MKAQFGIATNAYLQSGIMLIFFLGAILPEDKEEMRADNIKWRIVLSVSLWLSVLQIMFYMCCIRQEPVGFSIANGDDQGAKALLRNVYK